METKEQKEQETLDISKLTRFQKRQIISLFEKYSSENMEINRGSFQVCPKCGKKHPRLIKAGKTKGGKQMYQCRDCGRRFVEDIGRPSYYSWHDMSAWRIFIEDTLEGSTLDESAEKLGIFHSTAWSWRHRIMEKLTSAQDEIILSDKTRANLTRSTSISPTRERRWMVLSQRKGVNRQRKEG